MTYKPNEFAAFQAWRASAGLSNPVYAQAGRCILFLNAVELNLPTPAPSLIAGALAELHKLEAMM